MKLVLINPPVWVIRSPSCGISVLGAFLKKVNIPVKIYDLNLDFYNHILSETFLLNCVGKINEYLSYCKSKPSLTGEEIERLDVVLQVIGASDDIPDKIRELKKIAKTPQEKITMSGFERMNRIISLFLEIVSSAYYPLKLQSNQVPLGRFRDSADIFRKMTLPGFELFREYFEKKISEIAPHGKKIMVGFSCTSLNQIPVALMWSRMLKEHHKNVHIVIGGAYLSLLRHNYKSFTPLFDYIDSLIVCEGQHALLKLYKALKNNRDYTRCPNLIWRDSKTGKVHFNQPVVIEKIEDYPPPLFNEKKIWRPFTLIREIPLPVSRGCYCLCTFCGYNQNVPGGWEEDPPPAIVNKMAYLKKKYNSSLFMFAVSAMPFKTLLGISREIIRRRLKVYWYLQTRLDKPLSLDECQLLARGGCILLNFGIESANKRILKLMKKGISLEGAGETFSNLKRAGISVGLNFIYNFPTETLEEFEETLLFIKEHKKHIMFFLMTPFRLVPFSGIWNSPEKYGIRYRKHKNNNFLSSFRLLNPGVPVKTYNKKMKLLEEFYRECETDFYRTDADSMFVRKEDIFNSEYLCIEKIRKEKGLKILHPPVNNKHVIDFTAARFRFYPEQTRYFCFSKKLRMNGKSRNIDYHILYNKKSMRFIKLNYNPSRYLKHFQEDLPVSSLLRKMFRYKEERDMFMEHIKLFYDCGILVSR